MSRRDRPDDAARPDVESFAQRWSRRKLAQRTEAEAAPEPPESVPEPEPESKRAEIAAESIALPDIELLHDSSDFSVFLRDGVATELRRKALHKLFHLPEFNVLDGLNDYDEDYTKFEKLGDTVTYIQRRWQALEEAKEAAKHAEEETGAPEQPMAEVSDSAQVELNTAEDEVEDDGDLQG